MVAIQSAGQPTLRLNGSAGDITLEAAITYNTSSDSGPGPAIQNVAGNNTIAGEINLRNGGGGNTRIRVDGGSLALTAATIHAAPDATSARTLYLDGAGNGRVDAVLANGVGNPTATPPVAPQNLVLNKAGSGVWTLNAVNTYTGNTTISGGTLKLGAAASIATTPLIEVLANTSFDVTDVPGFTLAAAQVLRGEGKVLGSVTLATGATISPGTNSTAGTLATGTLNLSGGTLIVNLATRGAGGAPTSDLLVANGDVNITAPSIISFSPTGALLNGSYPLITYSGAFTGDAGTLALVNPTRYTIAVDTTMPGQINLAIGGTVAHLIWLGDGVTNTWNAATTGIWSAGAAERFYQTDAVTFDDTAAGANTSITVSGTLYPSAVNVNATQNYIFSGTGVIAGVGGLTKNGDGSLTVNNSNSFTGKTQISGGSLVLGATGKLTGTRWIQVDAGAVFDVQAVAAGFNLGGVSDQRVLSGRGQIRGNISVTDAGVIKPGDSSANTDSTAAGDGFGTLSFAGNLTLAGGAAASAPRVVLQVAGPTGSVVDPFDTASVRAFGSAAAAQHDQIVVAGTLTLDAGSTIRLELTPGYTPNDGDVFNIADWSVLNLNGDASGDSFNAGAAGDLDLPVLPPGLYWNRSLFTSDGLLFISPEPPQVGTVAISPASIVNPGTSVTLSVEVTGAEPYTYQWRHNNSEIANATGSTLVLTATEADEGAYTVIVSNPAGHTASAAASLL